MTSVVSEVTGYSSRRLLDRLLRSDEPMTEEVISELVHTSLVGKSKELEIALDGLLSELQKELLIKVLDHIDDMSRRIADLDDFAESRWKDTKMLSTSWMKFQALLAAPLKQSSSKPD